MGAMKERNTSLNHWMCDCSTSLTLYYNLCNKATCILDKDYRYTKPLLHNEVYSELILILRLVPLSLVHIVMNALGPGSTVTAATPQRYLV